MAKKSPATTMAAPLRPRIDRALEANKTQQALELANQLFKDQATEANRDLLKRVILLRAKQLRLEGRGRDVAGLLEPKLALAPDDAGWRAALAEEMAAAGAIEPAVRLMAFSEDAAARARVLARAADAALEVGGRAREQLPEELRAGYDLIVRAFQANADGKDEAVREALQGIGLQSPFLEWKLLLRGLLAFQAGDNARACENWQRLSIERVPAQMVAPLRLGIDPAFRAAQTPDVQLVLQRAADRFCERPDLVPTLRRLQAALARPDQLNQAFRLAADLLPRLQQTFPDLVPRLKACLTWMVISEGEVADLNRLRRTLGIPENSPEGERLAALFWEEKQEPEGAHHFWQAFQLAVEEQPNAWGGTHADHVRSLAFERMADLAAHAGPPPALAGLFGRAPTFKPNAEACLKKAIELAPNRRAPYLALLHHYESQKKKGEPKADKLALSMLKRFPDEADVWESLGERAAERGAWADAVGYYAEALRCSPLDARLRERTAQAHLGRALREAASDDGDAARASFAAALALAAPESRGQILGTWAAAEHRRQSPDRAQELLAQAHADPATRLPARSAWLVELIRAKQPKAMKLQADRDFAAALADALPLPAVVAMVRLCAVHRQAGKYTGQAGHEKKVLALLQKTIGAPFTELQMEWLCGALQALDAFGMLRTLAVDAQKRYPQNALFALSEAYSYMAPKGRYSKPWMAMEPITRAQALAEAMPEGSGRRKILDFIRPVVEHLAAAAPRGIPSLSDMFSQFDGAMEDSSEDPW